MDGEAYSLRRLDGPPVPPEPLAAALAWRSLRHPSLVALVDAFTATGPAADGRVGSALKPAPQAFTRPFDALLSPD